MIIEHREEGFYWVRNIKGAYVIARWHHVSWGKDGMEVWLMTGRSRQYHDYELLQIIEIRLQFPSKVGGTSGIGSGNISKDEQIALIKQLLDTFSSK